MSKKFISLFLVLLVISLTFFGCGKGETVKINGTKIDAEITAYFKNSAKEGEDANLLIARYVAINSEFQNRALSVPKSMRASLSDSVNDIWHLWGNYYGNLGISKETIYKIELSKVYETLLLEEHFGENGASPVSEKDIKQYFRENYAAVRFVTGYLFEVTESGTTEMTDEQKNKLTAAFTSAAESVNGGTGIEEAVGSLGTAEIHHTVVNSKGNDNFPEGFWEEVKKIEINKAAVISLGSYMFLVQRVSGEEGEYESYSQYRSNCLYQMKGDEFSQIIDSWTENYNVT